MRRWLTVDQAAEALGLHRSTVIRQIGEGTITGARRVGRQWRIPAAAVAAPPDPLGDALRELAAALEGGDAETLRQAATATVAAARALELLPPF